MIASPLPMPVIYAGLGGCVLALLVATYQQNWKCRTFFLLALRLAIGWHFLFEGLYKINSAMVGPTETSKPFTSEPYFKASPTKLGAMMRTKFDNPQAVIDERLKIQGLPSVEAFRAMSDDQKAAACPEKMSKEFADLMDDTVKKIEKDADAEIAKLEEALANWKDEKKRPETKEYIAADESRLLADQKALDELKQMKAEWDARLIVELNAGDDTAKWKKLKDEAKKQLTDLEAEAKKAAAKRDADFKKTIGEMEKKIEEKIAAAKEKKENAKKEAEKAMHKAKITYTAWMVGAQGQETKVKFTTGDAALTAGERLAHLDWLRGELAKAEANLAINLGNGNGVEMKHAGELRNEVMAAESELAADAMALNLKKDLTGKEIKADKTASEGARLDRITMWFIAVVGACILFGLFTRLSCLLAAGFLVVTYLTHPAVPWYPLPPGTEGNPLFINKNIIECLALLVLVCYPTGRWLGLDAWISRFLLKKQDDA